MKSLQRNGGDCVTKKLSISSTLPGEGLNVFTSILGFQKAQYTPGAQVTGRLKGSNLQTYVTLNPILN